MMTQDQFQYENKDCCPESHPIETREELEEIVTFTRLELYNRSLPCGPKAIRNRLEAYYLVNPLPSESTIARILKKRCLTQSRTGCYET